MSSTRVAKQRNLNAMIDHRARPFHGQPGDNDECRRRKHQSASRGIRIQPLPDGDWKKKRQDTRHEKQVLFRLHKKIVRERPGSLQNDRLFGRIKVNVPVSAADPCAGHANRRHHRGYSDAARVFWSRVQRLNEYPQSCHTSGNTERSMRQKQSVFARDIQNISSSNRIYTKCAPLTPEEP